MIKLVTVLKRRSDMTRREFEHRWLHVHAPIAAVFPNLRGYVLSFSIEDGEPQADGVAQLWFDDREAVQTSYASQIGREGSNDAREYLARRDHLMVSEEWAGPADDSAGFAYKMMLGLKRPDGRSRAQFVADMQALDHDTLQQGFATPTVRVCVDEQGKQLNSGVDGALDLFEAEAVFDALVEAWYPDAQAMRSAAGAFEQSQANAALAGLSSARETFLLHENVVVAPPELVQPAHLLDAIRARG
ncbi:EthD family reductase [Tepidamorphus sp. 3E244]|uniref:EthD family reductase n=1 Tax=Tepidamorphus sp. 3E244 TaxID=3385498 RepID=UPI0038FC2C1E